MDDGASRPWAELTADSLREIADRLCDNTADYVRFHAVCRLWREVALPPTESMPRFAPCLMTRFFSFSDGINFYSPFSRTSFCLPLAGVVSGRRSETTDPTGGRILTAGDSNDDSTASLINPLTGDVTALPSFPRALRGRGTRCCTVLTNGAVVVHTATGSPLRAVILEPGHGEPRWKDVDVELDMTLSHYMTDYMPVASRLAMAMCTSGSTLSGGPCAMAATMPMPPVNPADIYRLRYVFEFQGELLCADIVCAGVVSVTVHVLDAAAGKEPRWVERPYGCDDNEHVCMFLGSWNSSFAMDAREFGGGGKVAGGCAYFVQYQYVKKRAPREMVLGLCKYSFKDRKTTMVVELPETARLDMMWFLPRPHISPVSAAP